MIDLFEKKVSESIQFILLTFAEFYKYPSDEFLLEVYSGQLDKEMTALFSNVHFPYETKFREKVEMGIPLKKQYHHIFSGVKKPYVLPVESIYKQWTNDVTVQLSIAKSKGYLMGDTALHMNHLFTQYGIEVPEEYRFMPDHITLQLEFLVLLQKLNHFANINQFMIDHLDWLPFMIDELKPLDDSSFYVYVTEMLQKFLEHYKRLISREINERSEPFYV